jgi:hypothetical protein
MLAGIVGYPVHNFIADAAWILSTCRFHTVHIFVIRPGDVATVFITTDIVTQIALRRFITSVIRHFTSIL